MGCHLLADEYPLLIVMSTLLFVLSAARTVQHIPRMPNIADNKINAMLFCSIPYSFCKQLNESPPEPMDACGRGDQTQQCQGPEVRPEKWPDSAFQHHLPRQRYKEPQGV
jgi:hypothetical protein